MDNPEGHTVVSFLGTQLDRGIGRARWNHWRPNVSICQHEDLLVNRLVLLGEPRYQKLVDTVTADVASVSPETTVEWHQLGLRDPWDFEEVFDRLLSFAEHLALDPERDNALVHMTTGTHVAQICLFLLTETRHFPARLLQTGPPLGHQRDPGDVAGTYQIIDLDLSRFDRLAQRFAQELRFASPLPTQARVAA